GDAIAQAVLPREERDMAAEWDPAIAELLADRAEAKQARDEYDQLLDVIDVRVKAALGTREGVACDGWRVSFRVQSGRRMIDMERLKKEYPQAYEACLSHAKPSRPLRIYAV